MNSTSNALGIVKYKINSVLDYREGREHRDLFILNCGKDEVVMSIMTVTTDILVPTYLQGYFWSMMKTQHI